MNPVKSFCFSIGFVLAIKVLPSFANEPFTIDIAPTNSIQLSAFGSPKFIKKDTSRVENTVGGSEKSECRSYGRQSSSSGIADVKTLYKTSTSLAFDMYVSTASFGGIYRTCAACINDNCVGINPDGKHDTEATAIAKAVAVLAVRFNDQSQPSKYLLDVSSVDQGKVATIIVKDKNGNPLTRSKSQPGSYEIESNPGHIYYITASLDASSKNEGGGGDDKDSSQSRVDVKVRKPPLLSYSAGIEPFIVGGAQTDSYKNVGAILIKGDLHCTASVVGARSILTAAHCLHGYEDQYEDFTFIVGQNITQPTFGPIKLVAFMYPNGAESNFKFNPETLDDDIAIIYTKDPLGIEPVELHSGSPDWGYLLDNKISLTFVGYGYDLFKNDMVAHGIKREASWWISSVQNRKVSFSVPGKNTCKGDSGGPAFFKDGSTMMQVAVTSGGTPDCKTGFETRIDNMSDWLRPKIK